MLDYYILSKDDVCVTRIKEIASVVAYFCNLSTQEAETGGW